jgi:dolichol-phosphate mannosyltransferase
MPAAARVPAVDLVVPIYNEEPIIGRLHAEVAAAMQATGCLWRVIYVNDGSRDRSLEFLLQLQREDSRVTVLELSRNWGHQASLTAGIAHADADAVILMDGDLQDPPSVIPRLIARWREGMGVVVAERRKRADGFVRRGLFWLFYRILGLLSDFPIPLNAGIFGLLDRQAVDAVKALGETNRYLPGLRAWVGFRTSIVLYDRADRAGGEPKQTFWKLCKYGLDAVFSFSYKPLRLSLLIGLVTSLFAMLYGAALLGCRIFGVGMFGRPVVDGYTTTIVSILFLGGVQLMCVGILGEYIGRIYDEVKRRPLYLVRKLHKPAVA